MKISGPLFVLALLTFSLLSGATLASPVHATTACSPPQITSVSTITTDTSETITIEGCGFGTSPQTVSNFLANDGSVDTVESTTTPSLAIFDSYNQWLSGYPCTTDCWEAGFAINPSIIDSIGIYIESWTNTKIVINGFGSLLGTTKQWNIAVGDEITMYVVGPDCSAATSSFPPFPSSCTATYSTTVQTFLVTSVYPIGVLGVLAPLAALIVFVLRSKKTSAFPAK
jgi:hypothetical protein